MKDFIPGNSNQDSYFINYSDGQPYYNEKGIWYRGKIANDHTRRQVDKIRGKGIKVLSYFISDDDYYRGYGERDFKQMYGSDARFINPTNVMQVAKTMNEKFLQK
jgi:nitric oxide reductase activation protein